jgi:cell division septum initiation protein DivIVA
MPTPPAADRGPARLALAEAIAEERAAELAVSEAHAAADRAKEVHRAAQAWLEEAARRVVAETAPRLLREAQAAEEALLVDAEDWGSLADQRVASARLRMTVAALKADADAVFSELS